MVGMGLGLSLSFGRNGGSAITTPLTFQKSTGSEPNTSSLVPISAYTSSISGAPVAYPDLHAEGPDSPDAGVYHVFANRGISPGEKVAFQVQLNHFGFGRAIVGLGTASLPEVITGDTTVGQDNNGVAWYPHAGTVRRNGTDSGTTTAIPPQSVGSVAMFLVDLSAGVNTLQILLRSGGVSTIYGPWAVPSATILYPVVKAWGGWPDIDYTIWGNPGGVGWLDSQTPPSGFVALTGGAAVGSGVAYSTAELNNRIATSTGGETILLASGVTYGKITLSGKNPTTPVLIKYIGTSNYPTITGIDLTTCSKLTFENFIATRNAADPLWTSTNPTSQVLKMTNSNNVIFTDIQVQGGSSRAAASAAVDTQEGGSKGANYLVGDKIVFSGGGGSGAAATVSAVNGTGGITGITMDNVGSGYSSTPSVTVTNSVGGATTGSGVALQPYLGPITHRGAFGTWNNCEYITITRPILTNCSAGINLVGCRNITIATANISQHYGDGINYSGDTDTITITNPTFTDFYAVPYDHTDLIQGFTLGLTGAQRIKNISVSGMTYTRGSGVAAQGFFNGDEINNGTQWYENLSFTGGSLSGSAYNAVISDAAGSIVRNTTAVGLPGADALGQVISSVYIVAKGTSIRLTGNATNSYQLPGGETLNVTSALFLENTGNTIV